MQLRIYIPIFIGKLIFNLKNNNLSRIHDKDLEITILYYIFSSKQISAPTQRKKFTKIHNLHPQLDLEQCVTNKTNFCFNNGKTRNFDSQQG